MRKRRDIWGASRDGLKKDEKTDGLKKKRGNERTQPPTSNKGVNKFINKTDDEHPDEPTSNVGSSSERPVLARRLRIWEHGNSIKKEGKILNEYIAEKNLLENDEYSIKVEERL